MSSSPVNTVSASPEMPKDFPDWLNPVLVKEVRQGLRTRLFLSTFLVPQILLLVWMFYSSVELSYGNKGTAIDFFFWLIVFAGLYVATIPALMVVRGERRHNTLELLLLTRQGGFSIVWGKWLSIMLQALIFASSLMPYFILRYFFNTFDLVRDGSFMVIALSVALVISSIRLHGSSLPLWQNIATEILGGIFLIVLLGMVSGELTGKVMKGDESWGLVMLWFVCYAMLYSLMFLFLAASNIKGNKENFATRKRLLGLFLLLPPAIAWGVDAFEPARSFLFASTLPMLLIISSDAIFSTSLTSPSMYAAFKHHGLAGRLFALLVAPTRSSGICYFLFFFSVLIFLLFFRERLTSKSPPREIIAMILILVAEGVLAAFALARFSFRFVKRWQFNTLLKFFFFVEGVLALFSTFGYFACREAWGKASFEWVIAASATPWGALVLFERSSPLRVLTPYALIVGLILVLALWRYFFENLRKTWKICKGEPAEITEE